jgi:hypothetical protein
MYVNGKFIPIETISGMGEEIKENGGSSEFKYYLLHNIVRTFVNVMMYPYPAPQ